MRLGHQVSQAQCSAYPFLELASLTPFEFFYSLVLFLMSLRLTGGQHRKFVCAGELFSNQNVLFIRVYTLP